MKKTNLLIISIVLLLALFGVSLSFASNIGRTVYGVYTENYNGGHYNAEDSDVDAIELQLWEDQSMVGECGNASPVEGKEYLRLRALHDDASQQLWKYGGGGYVAVNKVEGEDVSYKDMSGYYGGNVKFYARSKYQNMKNFRVGIKVNDTEVYVALKDLGFTASGDWEEVVFPLTSTIKGDITSENLKKTNILFLFNMQEKDYIYDETIELDNIRWVKSGAGSFDVKLKNISDDAEASVITWSQDVFRNGWKVAGQYLEFDLDQDTSKNWHIKIYTDNDGVAGLKASDGMSSSLPMCWRIDKERIPYDYSASDGYRYKATFSIAQAGEDHNYGLYDSGVSATDPYYYPWFYFIDKEDENFGNNDKADYMTVWSYKGFHAADNGDYWGMADMNASGKKIAPKLYFGADFSKAIAGSTSSPNTYTSNIKVEFVNE